MTMPKTFNQYTGKSERLNERERKKAKANRCREIDRANAKGFFLAGPKLIAIINWNPNTLSVMVSNRCHSPLPELIVPLIAFFHM